MRNDAQENEVLDALARWPQALCLAGVEVYEGVLKEEAEIRQFLQHAVAITRQLAESGWLQRSPAILSGAGSGLV